MFYTFVQKIKEDYLHAKFSPLLLYLYEPNLKTGDLKEFQQFLYELMKPFSAFFVIIKTNFG